MRMRLLASLGFLVELCGCGSFQKYLFYSPDRSKAIEIRQPWIDASLAVEVLVSTSTGYRKTLLKAGETNITFAFAHWNKSSSRVGLLVCGTRQIKMAFDFDQQKEIAFSQVQRELSADMIRRYGRDNSTSSEPSDPTACIGDFYATHVLGR